MKKVLLSSALMLAAATPLLGQSAPCDVNEFCRDFDNAEVSLARAGMAASGGNPVPGASSTLGIRLGTLPRLSIAGRVTGTRLVISDESTASTADELSSIARSLNVDAAIGIFSGFSLLPTVGGFGSIDLLASYGKVSLSDGDGFVGDPTSWAAGVRVGILRESFTAPGIALSGLYRKIGDFSHEVGEPAAGGGTIMRLENNRALSLRGTVGKRILMLGATAGIGYDKYSSDAEFLPPETLPPTPVQRRELERSATTIFGNLSWTMLILHIVGEGGVQRLQDGDSGAYGSLAVRISL